MILSYNVLIFITGKTSMFWNGKTPRLIISNPELMKEILLNKLGHIQKPPINPLILILARGLTVLEGEKWAIHRRLINPAFHLEKLKVSFTFGSILRKIIFYSL